MVAVMACSASLAIWMLTHRQDCAFSGAAFGIYALETVFILYDEYAHTKLVMSENYTMGLTFPALTLALSLAFVFCVWGFIICRTHAEPPTKALLAAAMAYGVQQLVCLPMVGRSNALLEFLFYGARDLALIASLGFALWQYRHTTSKLERHDMARAKRFFIVACVLAVVMFCEDLVNIMLPGLSPINLMSEDFRWHFTERNITENVLMVACAIQLIRANRDTLLIYARHPQEAKDGGRGVTLDQGVEQRVLLYCDEHEMSNRERDVVRLVVEGKDIQGIASELYISTGTVKSHLHRIYKKAGVASRKELVDAFWKSR